MDKLLDSKHPGHEDIGKVTLLFDEKGLTKQAAAQEIDDYVHNIPVKEGFFYIHINAMGAGEYYGSNRNGDYFPEAQLIEYHKTFETTPAHLFRHHVNKDPSIAIGRVIFSYYNPRMHRVELIVEADKVKARDEYERLKRGEYPATSMACHTPYDMCSICGNQARALSQYCEHLTGQMNTLFADGRKVMAMNVAPLKFFDISIVIRPADITSSVLEKVANHQATIPSAEIAEATGVSYHISKEASIKKEALDKMADLIKEIEGGVVDYDESLDPLLDRVVDPEDSLIDLLHGYPLGEVLNAFAEVGISPSLEFLSKYFASLYLGRDKFHIGPVALAVANNVGLDQDLAGTKIPEIEEKNADPMLVKLLVKYIDGSSLSPEMVEKRATYLMESPGKPSGYTNWDLGRSSPELNTQVVENQGGILDTLLTIAGSAMLAKYMLAGLVDRKLEKQNSWLKSSVGRSFTKNASVTIKLMEGDLRRQSKARG